MVRGISIKIVAIGLALLVWGLGAATGLSAYGAGAADEEILPVSQFHFAPGVIAQEEGSGLRVLATDETGVILELVTHAYQIQETTVEGEPCQKVIVADYAGSDRPGWPYLPVQGAMVGIPLQATVTLTVLENDAVTLPGSYDLCPVPQPIGDLDLRGEIASHGQGPARDPDAYASNAQYPALPVELVSTGTIRSQHVAQLRFHPFRYNPGTGELFFSRRIRVRLDFAPVAGQILTSGSGVEEGWFERILEHALLNYEIARQWRARPKTQIEQSSASAQDLAAYRVVVDEDGIYEITPGDLQAVGLAVDDVDPRTWQLHNQGGEVAIYVTGEGDGSFDSQDSIFFYGQKAETKYSDANVYWLTWGGADGQRMEVRDGSPGGFATVSPAYWHSSRVEENLIYNSKTPMGEDQDHWFWNYVYGNGSPASKDYTIALGELAEDPFIATIRGALAGYQTYTSVSPDHHTEIYLNGYIVDDATWDGQTAYYFEAQVPRSYLVEGDNQLTVRCPVDLGLPDDAVYANWFAIDYQRKHIALNDQLRFGNESAGVWAYHLDGFVGSDIEVFDITDPTNVGRIAGGVLTAGTLEFEDTITASTEYLALTTALRLEPVRIALDAPSNLHSTENGADYLIITHGDFYTDVLPLADYRASQGLRTAVVDVQDVYDEFAYGLFDPTAIHSFLEYAYAHWALSAPAYVLLVGDGSLDFKDYMGTGYLNFIPPYLAAVDPWINETASDNRYVCISGDDALPDMHIGRLPANSPAEASAMVTKILNYEQNPPPGGWNQQVLFVADNEDEAGDFASFSDEVANRQLPAPYSAQRVYLGVTHGTTGEARAAIVGAINEGRLLVNYVGHASYQWWATEQLLSVSNIASLTNGPRLPVMVPMTCYDGFFHAPGIPSMGESLVRAAGNGAIASWSPTGLGVAMGHDYLNKGLYEAFFFDDIVQLGPATTQAKLHLYASTAGYRDLLDTYLLFGDPALALNVLPVDLSLQMGASLPATALPGDGITYTLTFSNAGPATARGVVLSDALPAALLNPVAVSTGAALTPLADSRLAWQVADLAAGEGGVVTITATLDPGFSGLLVHTAQITSTAREANLVDNRASHAVIVNEVWHKIYLPVILRLPAPLQFGAGACTSGGPIE